MQTDASGAEDTTSYTHNQAGDVTSIQEPRTPAPPAPTTDLQCFAYNDMQELTTAWTDNGTHGPAPTSPNPGRHWRLRQPHPGRLDHRRPGAVLEHFGEPALRSTARVDARYIGGISQVKRAKGQATDASLSSDAVLV
jgi:hypothetical protein